MQFSCWIFVLRTIKANKDRKFDTRDAKSHEDDETNYVCFLGHIQK